MTEEQYKKYQALTQEIKPVKAFLCWCGDRYRERTIGQYPFSIKVFGNKFSFRAKRYWVSETDNTFDIPFELQSRIVAVVKQYMDEKEKELEDI